MLTLDPPVVSGQTVTVSGTATPGAHITAEAVPTKGATVALGSTTAASNGHWTIASQAELSAGAWMVEVSELATITSSAEIGITVGTPGVMSVQVTFINGLTLSVASNDSSAVALDDYVDPLGRFVLQRSVVRCPEIRGGYQIIFGRHADDSRQTVEFIYGDPTLPVPLIAAITSANPCVITTTLPHGLSPNQVVQARGVGSYPTLNAQNALVTSVLSPTQFAVNIDTSSAPVTTSSHGWVGPGNLPQHTVAIYQGSTLVYQATVPQHIYMGQWRWQSAPLPRSGDVASLVASGALPHYDMTDLPLSMYRGANKFSYTPMAFAGLASFQGQTGERNDIGPITGWTAECLVDPTMIDTIFAQAEAWGSFPWAERDATTTGPFDALTNNLATHYANQSTPPPHYIPIASCRTAAGGAINPDAGHCPQLNYVPFLLTGDPYYLLQAQMEAMYWLVVEPPTSRYNLDGRYCAWTLRNMFLATLITPTGTLPSWLHSRAYMEEMLDNYHTRIQTLQNPTPLSPIHLTGDGGGSQDWNASMMAGSYQSVWTEDFIVIVEAWITEHFPEWMPDLLWKIENTIQRCNGTSGWNPAQPAQYRSAVRPSCRTTAAIGATGNAPFTVGSTVGFNMAGAADFPVLINLERMQVKITGPNTMQPVSRAIDGTHAAAHNTNQVVLGDCYVDTYGHWWQLNQQVQPEHCNTSTTAIDTTRVNQDYTGYVLAALAFGAHHSVPGALAAYNKLHTMALAKLSRSWHWGRKFSITPG